MCQFINQNQFLGCYNLPVKESSQTMHEIPKEKARFEVEFCREKCQEEDKFYFAIRNENDAEHCQCFHEPIGGMPTQFQ